MDAVIFQFLLDVTADDGLRRARPDICERAAQLLVDETVIEAAGVDIGDRRLTAHC